MLSNTYGETAISETTCCEWFHRFKDMTSKPGMAEVFKDAALEALLHEDSCHM